MYQLEECDRILVGFDDGESRGCLKVILEVHRTLIIDMVVCLGHTVVVYLEFVGLFSVGLLPLVFFLCCEGNRIVGEWIDLEGGFFLDVDRHVLHF